MTNRPKHLHRCRGCGHQAEYYTTAVLHCHICDGEMDLITRPHPSFVVVPATSTYGRGCPKCGERHPEGESCLYYDPDPTDG